MANMVIQIKRITFKIYHIPLSNTVDLMNVLNNECFKGIKLSTD